MDDYYFEGDPAVDSTRRHLERVLEGKPSRRWPWVVAAVAGGAAFAFWRFRSRPTPTESAAEVPPAPTREVQQAR